jgi:hypothetical protein
MKQFVLHTMLPLKPPNFEYNFFFKSSLPLANVQFNLGFSFASSNLLNVASLSSSSDGSSSLPSHFSTFASLNQSCNTHGPHVPCDPINGSTLGASSSIELGTLGVASSIELQGTLSAISFTKLQGTLGAISFTKLQGTLGATNYISFCSCSSRGASSSQAHASREPTKKEKKKKKD